MDYGVRLFRHVVAQVFGNLVPALKLSLLPLIVMGAVGTFAFFSFLRMMASVTSTSTEAATFEQTFQFLVTSLIAIVLWLALFTWIAVGWHRFILLEEHGTGYSPRWKGDRFWAYLWRLVLLGIVLVFAAGLLVQLTIGVFGQAALFLIGFGANFLFAWVFTRLGLILPASAVGAPLGVAEAWRATRPVSGEILVPIIGFALLFYLLQVVLQLVSEPLGVLVLPVFLGLAWVQMLVNLSLLTTLYGNLVEGRALN